MPNALEFTVIDRSPYEFTLSDGTFNVTVQQAIAIPATTSDIAEGTNLYFTNGRADTRADLRIAAQKGVAGGLASLDSGGKVPSSQLPSYVDDVLEFASLVSFPITGSSGVIYVALDTNKGYRWSGSAYVEVSSSEVTSVNGLTGAVTLTKSSVGLGNADNTSDLNKPVSTAQQTALDAKATVASLTAHTTNTANPHAVTKAQVGLGSVLNAAQLQVANNLLDVASIITARQNIGAQARMTVTFGSSGTEDYSDIAAAVAAVGAGGGGTIVPSPGSYGLTSWVPVNYDNVAVVAPAEGTVTFYDASTSGLSFLFRSSVTDATTRRRNIRLENLTLDGMGKSDVGFTSHNCDGLTLRKCKIGNMKTSGNWALNITSIDPSKNSSPTTAALANNCLIDECEFYNAGASQDLVAFGHGSNVLFRRCIFRDAYSGTAGLLSISDGTRKNANVDRCIFYEAAPSGASAIYMSVTCSGGKINMCDVRSISGAAIELGGTDTQVIGGYYEGKIRFRSDTIPARARVLGTTVDSSVSGGSGIELHGSGHTVTNNTVTPQTAGIYLNSDVTDSTIIGNQIHNANDSALNSNSGIEVRGARNTVGINYIYDDRAVPLMKRAVYLSNATHTKIFGNTFMGAVSNAIEGVGTTDRTFLGSNTVISGASTIALVGSRTGAIGDSYLFTEIDDSNGNQSIELTATASAVNHFNFTNAAAASTPSFTVKGSDTNIGLIIQTKGGGGLFLRPGSNNTQAVRITSAGGSAPVATFDTTNSRVLFGPGTNAHSTVQVTGSLAVQYKAVSDANYAVSTAQTTSDCLIGYTSLTATRTVTLPTAASVTGRTYFVVDESAAAGTYNIVVATTSGQTINGSATATIAKNNGYLAVYSDGSNWHILFSDLSPMASGSWGTITGTLSAQNDLQAALDAKSAAPAYTRFNTYSSDMMVNATHAAWIFQAISSGTVSNVSSVSNHPGVVGLVSSTTANSGYRVQSSTSGVLIAGGETTDIVFRIPVTTGTTSRLGFQDASSVTDATDGVYMEFMDAVLTGKTSSNGTRSSTGTTYTITANTWYRARITVNSAATLATFTLYSEAGSQLWTDTLSTNLPTGSSRETGHGVVVTNSGTTAQTLFHLDYMDMAISRTMTR